jgi:Tfp pilus assembly protein PilN
VNPQGSKKRKNKNKMTYSSSASISRQRYSSRGQNAVSFKSESKRLGPVSNAIALLVMVCLIGLVYLTQVTKTNSFSYEINSLEQQQSQLKEEQKDLELTAARLRAVDNERLAQASQGLVSVAPNGTITQPTN